MLPRYHRGHRPLTECTVAKVGGSVRWGKERTISFPVALRKHQEEDMSANSVRLCADSVAVAPPAPIA